MNRIEDRITTTDIRLAALGIFAGGTSEGRRLYPIPHAITRANLGGVTVTESGDSLTITVTDAKGAIIQTETATTEAAADRIAEIINRIAYADVTPDELRDARLTSLRYIGTGAAHITAQRDALVIEARTAGATYQQIADAAGLSRAQLDRIINDRGY